MGTTSSYFAYLSDRVSFSGSWRTTQFVNDDSGMMTTLGNCEHDFYSQALIINRVRRRRLKIWNASLFVETFGLPKWKVHVYPRSQITFEEILLVLLKKSFFSQKWSPMQDCKLSGFNPNFLKLHPNSSWRNCFTRIEQSIASGNSEASFQIRCGYRKHCEHFGGYSIVF